MKSKNEIIETIMGHNTSATAEFLAEFSLIELTDYLEQLEAVRERAAESTEKASSAGTEAEPQAA